MSSSGCRAGSIIAAGLRRLYEEYEVMSGIDAQRDIAAMEAADIARQGRGYCSEGEARQSQAIEEVSSPYGRKAAIEDLNADWVEFKKGAKKNGSRV